MLKTVYHFLCKQRDLTAQPKVLFSSALSHTLRRRGRLVHTSGETVPDTDAAEALVAGRVGNRTRVAQAGETTGTGTVRRSLDGSVSTLGEKTFNFFGNKLINFF